MTEVVKVEPPGGKRAIAQPTPTTALAADEKSTASDSAPKIKSISTSVVGNRLQISADVGADEIDALKDMLGKYQEILKLLH